MTSPWFPDMISCYDPKRRLRYSRSYFNTNNASFTIHCSFTITKRLIARGQNRTNASSKMTDDHDAIKCKHFPRYRSLMLGITGHWWVSCTKASDAELWCFHLRLYKRFSKQSWGWWFETPMCSLWRLCNDHDLLEILCPDLFDGKTCKYLSFKYIYSIFWQHVK